MRRAVLLASVLLVAACGRTAAPAVHVSPPVPDPGRKVMIIAEENHGYQQVIGSSHAPYLNQLAAGYGTAVNYDAGYPAHCPSLAAYILMTSGTTDGICDDKDPKAHRLTGDNVFHQVSTSGREWRAYAEASPGTCALTSHGRYLVRHVPATYYVDERSDCRRWAVPLGATGSGALHDDVARGTLPALSFVSPDACDDMHGAFDCGGDLVAAGDHWLRSWLPQIMAAPDYRSGRLTVIVTWDEGTSADNHIPALVLTSALHHVTATQPLSHCSTLRFTEEELHLPLLGCAAGAASLGASFGIQ